MKKLFVAWIAVAAFCGAPALAADNPINRYWPDGFSGDDNYVLLETTLGQNLPRHMGAGVTAVPLETATRGVRHWGR